MWTLRAADGQVVLVGWARVLSSARKAPVEAIWQASGQPALTACLAALHTTT